MRNPLRRRQGSTGGENSLLSFIDDDIADTDAEPLTPTGLRQLINRQQWTLARRIRITRVVVAAWVLAAASPIAACVLTIQWLDRPARVAAADTICGVVLAGAAGTLLAAWRLHLPSRREIALSLEINREAQRRAKARKVPELDERRALYREEVADIIEHFQHESRKYRRIHNSLQSLIMVGATSTTTVASLNTADDMSWQNITTVVISFAITLAATFTGYYKFRERSYFLTETADAIEEQANALALGVSPYEGLEESKALALFTSKVETLRNEQRRRQQQLDQPNQAATTAAGQAAE
ncbi:DUF4231 domain-containing protein [Actinacidiphila bryophytorum]|uniref:DUF4231 domain-containing protein n=1 Tax=Actinacidiphila bryophytorum TaxID=1436133 RepID=UPI002176C402|nr:DUF4231 domain-containing protein [Actinacidiphila bryophytorum]UWE10216.1 DUF4231 domain-containing protein [Actinacidiphila bryophytorum]